MKQTTVKEFITKMEEQGRKRCDKEPHINHIEPITKDKTHKLISFILGYDDYSEEYKDKYRPYLNSDPINIPIELLKRMYGVVLFDEENCQHCTYESCCR